MTRRAEDDLPPEKHRPADSAGTPLVAMAEAAGGEVARVPVAGDSFAGYEAGRERSARTKRALSASERYDFLIHRYLLVADLLAILAAAGLAMLAVTLFGREMVASTWWVAVVLSAPLWVLIAYSSGLYRMVERRLEVDFVDEFGPVVVGATAWIWILVVVRSAFFTGTWDVVTPLLLWLAMISTVLLFRSVVRRVVQDRPWFRRPVAVIGHRDEVDAVVKRMDRHVSWGLDPTVEIVRDEDADDGRVEILATGNDEWGPRFTEGDPARVAEVVAGFGIDRVVVTDGLAGTDSRTELIRELVARRIGVDVVSGGIETLYSTAVAHHMEGLPVLGVRPGRQRPVSSGIKRLLDVVISAAGLVAVSPILLWAAIRIKRDSPGPVFYRQTRIGLDGRRFEVLKLRTMVDGAHGMHDRLRDETVDHGNGDVLFKLKEDPRITDSGRFLRIWSLDEFPQLWNVLKGDMSMVGPRPLIPGEAVMVTGHCVARETVRPGIAGPWQILGRSEIPFEDMIRLDYEYVIAWSNAEDMRLLVRTVAAVLQRKGAY